MKNALIVLAAILAISLLSCTTTETAPPDFLSDAKCGVDTKDIAFTITNNGNNPFSIDKPIEGMDHLAIEVNGVEMTGVASYCGRQTLAPKEVVKCRRPGNSQTDVGVRIKTGAELLFLQASNSVRATLGDTTREVHIVCGTGR
ncbi:MAG: hypothetical protein AABX47_03925 [Nanoarchaeota archaeon]